MTTCECCQASGRRTDVYAVLQLDGSRGEVTLCLKCRERFRRESTVGLQMAPDAATAHQSDANRAAGHSRSHRAQRANDAPQDWRQRVYGGKAAQR
jgi:hypothetical protein